MLGCIRGKGPRAPVAHNQNRGWVDKSTTRRSVVFTCQDAYRYSDLNGPCSHGKVPDSQSTIGQQTGQSATIRTETERIHNKSGIGYRAELRAIRQAKGPQCSCHGRNHKASGIGRELCPGDFTDPGLGDCLHSATILGIPQFHLDRQCVLFLRWRCLTDGRGQQKFPVRAPCGRGDDTLRAIGAQHLS